MFKFRTVCIALSLAGCAVLAFAVWMVPQIAMGEDFRIESEVFQGSSRDPFAENLTLFHDGVVYDFMLTGSEEITVFDPQRGRAILLDPKRKVRTEVQLEQIRNMVEFQRSRIDPKQTPLLDPRLNTSFDQKSGWLTLASPAVTYQAKGIKPAEPVVVKRYQQFADWHARLNSVRRGSLSPFSRIKLNEALAKQQLLPEQVKLTLVVPKGLVQKKIQLRSQHIIIWQLSQTDRERIERVGRYLATFEPKTFSEFTGETPVATKPPSERR